MFFFPFPYHHHHHHGHCHQLDLIPLIWVCTFSWFHNDLFMFSYGASYGVKWFLFSLQGTGKGKKEKAGKSLVDLGYQRAKSLKAINKAHEGGKIMRKLVKTPKRLPHRSQSRTDEMQELFQSDMSERKQSSKRSTHGMARKKSKHSFNSKSR